MSILPRIGRSHLDAAAEEGRNAAQEPSADEDACPYLSNDQPMTRHAWLRGFREAWSARLKR
ncbi:ribosome modulation factor [Sphingomonas dokdonensis]|uniref:ribosome modulation factor n=1 Tax=Sphingomonas dokdonensis TaxID=344880 RepID=UPI003CCB9CCE